MPGGGDCDGTTGTIRTARDREPSLAGRDSCTACMDAAPANTCVTFAGGAWGLMAQQLALSDWHGRLICMQQLCVACCAGSTHVPTDSSSTPTMVMATAVRWPTIRNIVSA